MHSKEDDDTNANKTVVDLQVDDDDAVRIADGTMNNDGHKAATTITSEGFLTAVKDEEAGGSSIIQDKGANAISGKDPVAMDPTKVAVPLSRIPFALTTLGLMLAIFLASLDITIVATALKAIVNEFGHQDLIPWIGSAYLITACGFTLLYGKLADIFGRKWVFVTAVLVFEAGSILCGAATSMGIMIAGRAIAGIGGGGIISLVLIIIADIVSMQDRGKYQGMIGAIFGLSSVIGPLIGGAFADKGLWRWCFYINVPIGSVTLAVVIIFLNFPAPKGTFSEKILQIDFLGALIMLATVVCFVTPLQLGGVTWAWNAPQTIALFAVSAVLFALFVFVQLKVAPVPMVPPNIFMNASVYALLFVAFCLGASFFTANYYLAFYFQVVFGVSATIAGLDLVPLIFGVVALSITSGQLISRLGKYVHFLYIGGSIMTAGFILISFFTQYSSQAIRVIFLIILGLGIGNIIQVRLIALQASVDVPKIAVATAVSQFCLNVGGAVGIAVFGTIFNNVLATNMASKPELQYILTTSPNFTHVDTTQVAAVRGILSDMIGTVPNADIALSQLLDAFCAAFAMGFRIMIPFPFCILICALFVKQYTVKGHGGPKSKPSKEIEATQSQN